jgi:hypothetical protein
MAQIPNSFSKICPGEECQIRPPMSGSGWTSWTSWAGGPSWASRSRSTSSSARSCLAGITSWLNALGPCYNAAGLVEAATVTYRTTPVPRSRRPSVAIRDIREPVHIGAPDMTIISPANQFIICVTQGLHRSPIFAVGSTLVSPASSLTCPLTMP